MFGVVKLVPSLPDGYKKFVGQSVEFYPLLDENGYYKSVTMLTDDEHLLYCMPSELQMIPAEVSFDPAAVPDG